MPGTFVWSDGETDRRNDFCRFRREFELAAVPAAAVLHVFADSRYRLWVNEVLVMAGPARFVPSHPEFDTVDLGRWLRPGTNVLLAEATSYGASSYQTSRSSRAGFVAWGHVGELDLATPGAWLAQRATGWDREAPPFSFAQGPVEILDTRRDDPVWQAPVPVAGPWGALTPRSVPAASLAPVALSLRWSGPLDDRDRVIGYRWCEPGLARGTGPRRSSVYACELDSPGAQNLVIGIFWSRHWLNGELLACANDPAHGNRQTATLHLRPGPNLLYGEVEQLEEVWGLTLGFPTGPGAPALRSLRVAGLLAEGALPPPPATLAELPAAGLAWRELPLAEPPLPARVRAWDSLGAAPSRKWAWVFQAADEFVGYPSLELEAPAGSILDVGVDDQCRADGLLALYASNPFTHTVDRYVLRGGRQRVQGFHVRGGKYLQLTLTLPEAVVPPPQLAACCVRSANGEFALEGRFECSDPVLTWAWGLSARTLQVSVEDSTTDCPWRERGTYLGDAYVNLHMLGSLNREWRLPRRVLRLFAQSQFADGMMPSAAPSWMTRGHADFTLIWILLLHDYWRLSGDLETVRELWPTLERILASPVWQADEQGLWSGDGLNLFIDWGRLREETVGPANAALNAFRAQALADAAVLAAALGRDARPLAEAAAQVRAAFAATLWLPGEGRFAPFAGGTSPALHANILALRFGLGSPAQQAQVLDYVCGRLRHNLRLGVEQGQGTGFAELYFLFYTLEALYRHGRVALAEELLREHYGLMREHGATTLWECFSRGVRGAGSLCHSWSGAALVMASRYVLGVQPPDPACPDRLAVAPRAASITWARGEYPHRRGLVQVAWQRVDGELQVQVQAPPGVTVEVQR